jgi:hypothetical protein
VAGVHRVNLEDVPKTTILSHANLLYRAALSQKSFAGWRTSNMGRSAVKTIAILYFATEIAKVNIPM